MKPAHFAALACVAAVSLVVALLAYSSSIPWSEVRQGGAALFPQLQSKAAAVAKIEVRRTSHLLTLARNGDEWLIKEHDDYPASKDKVRALIVKLGEAQLSEPKTRRKDRFSLLEVEDPDEKNANSRSVRLLDAGGNVIAEAIVGKQRWDAFGSGKGGTYVRRPNEEQAWLVNTSIDAGTDLRDWVKPRLFETQRDQIKRITIEVPGEEPLEIVRDAKANEHKLVNMPQGMRLKDVNGIDNIAEAVSSFDFDDVRKAGAGPKREADQPSTATVELEDGVKLVATIRRADGTAWITFSATGSGDAKAPAEALMARMNGWEFQVPASKVNEILKKRSDLLEKASS